MRIGDLVEHQHHAFRRERFDIQRGQGIGLGEQALMHGVRAELLVDLARPHYFGCYAGIDIFLGKTPLGILGEEKPADPALRIGQRHRHRVPAIENGWSVRLCLAVAPGRAAAGSALVERLDATAELRFSVAIAHEVSLCHGFRIMAIWAAKACQSADRVG